MNDTAQSASVGRLLPGSRLGRYEILTRLASGGMAEVYAARTQGVAGFERLVAVKVLHANLAHEQEFISMFLDEARLAARIRHPNVVATLDISGSPQAGYFLVMDYIEGDHLGALANHAAKEQTRIPVPVVLRMIVDALSGLAAAHQLVDEQGKPLRLVHRDISPHNIMVGLDGVARLTDFGVAKAEDRLTHTREGQVKGKLAYMAPEHASQGHADQRADLFAMGVVLWECLTGQRLFRSDNVAVTLTRILNEPIPLPSSVDPELAPLDHVLRQALARPLDERFQSCEDFIDALEACAGEFGGIGTSRSVKKAVRRYAAEKLERDAVLIRRAIQTLAGEGHASAGDVSLLWESTGSSVDGSLPSTPSQLSRSARLPDSGVHTQPTASATIRAWPGAQPPPVPVPVPVPVAQDATQCLTDADLVRPSVAPQAELPPILKRYARHRWLPVALALGLLVLGGVGWLLQSQGRPDVPEPTPETVQHQPAREVVPNAPAESAASVAPAVDPPPLAHPPSKPKVEAPKAAEAPAASKPPVAVKPPPSQVSRPSVPIKPSDTPAGAAIDTAAGSRPVPRVPNKPKKPQDDSPGSRDDLFANPYR